MIRNAFRATFAALFFTIIWLPPSKAKTYATIEKALICKSFSVNATTMLTKPPSLFSEGRSQKIILTNKKSLYKQHVNLLLHKSGNRFRDSGLSLDSVAFTWKCLIGKYEQEFLKINFACINEGATTCMTAMDIPGASEWSAFYDSNGCMVLNTHHGLSPADQKRARALGLWPDLLRPSDTDAPLFVYE